MLFIQLSICLLTNSIFSCCNSLFLSLTLSIRCFQFVLIYLLSSEFIFWKWHETNNEPCRALNKHDTTAKLAYWRTGAYVLPKCIAPNMPQPQTHSHREEQLNEREKESARESTTKASKKCTKTHFNKTMIPVALFGGLKYKSHSILKSTCRTITQRTDNKKKTRKYPILNGK